MREISNTVMPSLGALFNETVIVSYAWFTKVWTACVILSIVYISVINCSDVVVSVADSLNCGFTLAEVVLRCLPALSRQVSPQRLQWFCYSRRLPCLTRLYYHKHCHDCYRPRHLQGLSLLLCYSLLSLQQNRLYYSKQHRDFYRHRHF